MNSLDFLLQVLQSWWLKVLLSITSILALVWKAKYVYQFLLRFTTYDVVEQEWVDRWLLENTLFKVPSITQKEHSEKEKTCPDCGSLLGYDNRQIINVKDIAGDIILRIHRDCIKKTNRRVFVYERRSFLQRKNVLKVAKLRNLWKMDSVSNETPIKSPKFMFATFIIPEGMVVSFLILKSVKPLENSESEEITKVKIPSEDILKAWEEGPWVKSHHPSFLSNRQKTKELHTTLVGFDTLAQMFFDKRALMNIKKKYPDSLLAQALKRNG